MKKKKLVIILIVFTLVLGGAVSLCNKKGTEEINSDYRVATKKV